MDVSKVYKDKGKKHIWAWDVMYLEPLASCPSPAAIVSFGVLPLLCPLLLVCVGAGVMGESDGAIDKTAFNFETYKNMVSMLVK